jgi:uncharacterized membrane protein
MNLYAYFRKYVWDDEKTPYFVPVARLSAAQARNEIFAFAVLLTMFAVVIAAAAVLGKAFQASAPGAALYASTVLSAAIVLGMTRHRLAAVYCGAAPLAALLYFFFLGFPPNLHMADELLILALLLGMLRYGMRITAIARTCRDPAKTGQDA